MFCNKCGKENDDDAAFCQKCGNAFEGDVETRVAKHDYKLSGSPTTPSSQSLGHPSSGRRGVLDATPPNQGGELDARIFSITPTTKFVMAGYVLAIIAAFLLVAVVSVFIPAVSAIIAVLIGLLLLLIPAYFHIRQKLTRYSLTDTTIEIDRGLISRTTQNIPLRRIQDVTVSATLFQRLLGYGDITIDNASEDGGKVVLDNVDSPRKYADHVLRQMRSLDRQ